MIGVTLQERGSECDAWFDQGAPAGGHAPTCISDASMPRAPNSFTSTAHVSSGAKACLERSRWQMAVVLPAPRAPVTIVTGTGSFMAEAQPGSCLTSSAEALACACAARSSKCGSAGSLTLENLGFLLPPTYASLPSPAALSLAALQRPILTLGAAAYLFDARAAQPQPRHPLPRSTSGSHSTEDTRLCISIWTNCCSTNSSSYGSRRGRFAVGDPRLRWQHHGKLGCGYCKLHAEAQQTPVSVHDKQSICSFECGMCRNDPAQFLAVVSKPKLVVMHALNTATLPLQITPRGHTFRTRFSRRFCRASCAWRAGCAW